MTAVWVAKPKCEANARTANAALARGLICSAPGSPIVAKNIQSPTWSMIPKSGNRFSDKIMLTLDLRKSEGARDAAGQETHGPRNLAASRHSGSVKPQVRRSLRRPARDVWRLAPPQALED
jgi:hypothetical protein